MVFPSKPTTTFAIIVNGLTSMKLDKGVVQRRLDLLAAEGIVSGGIPNTNVLRNYLDVDSQCSYWS